MTVQRVEVTYLSPHSELGLEARSPNSGWCSLSPCKSKEVFQIREVSQRLGRAALGRTCGRGLDSHWEAPGLAWSLVTMCP